MAGRCALNRPSSGIRIRLYCPSWSWAPSSEAFAKLRLSWLTIASHFLDFLNGHAFLIKYHLDNVYHLNDYFFMPWSWFERGKHSLKNKTTIKLLYQKLFLEKTILILVRANNSISGVRPTKCLRAAWFYVDRKTAAVVYEKAGLSIGLQDGKCAAIETGLYSAGRRRRRRGLAAPGCASRCQRRFSLLQTAGADCRGRKI